MPLSPGQILQGRYAIQSLLGQGGMGSVYRAFDQTLNRAVAIKERVPDPNATPQGLAQTRAQFQREAQVLANLHHDNLPRVTDYFSFGGNEYLVMDLIEGMGLDQVVQQHGAIGEGAVRAWMNQILDALIYIHSHQPPIIHRDIKPANIILKPDGEVALVDFGLVKLLDPTNPYTLIGMRGMGTPNYAPIEQFSPGMHTDARSDLYGLGATMYHLLSGRAPLDVPHRLVDPTQMPSLGALNPKISAQTEWVVQKAMEIQPQTRFASAAEMKQGLAMTAPTPPATPPAYIPPPVPVAPIVPATPLSLDRFKVLAVAFAGLVAACVLGFGLMYLGSWGFTELQKTSMPAVISAPTTGPAPSAPAPIAAPPSIPPAPKPAAGERPPAFTLKDLNNQDKVFLALIKDKSAVLVFWRDEPRYEEMMNTLQSYTTKGLVVVAVLPGGNVTAIKQRVEQRHWNQITMLINGEPVATQYSVTEQPTYFLIKHTGEIAERLGAGTQKPDLESKLNDLLK